MIAGVDPDDADLVAAEYVLGTLDSAERTAFGDRLRSDDAAKRAVARWDMRFAGLADRVAPVAPPPEIWVAIERALQPAPPRLIEVEGARKAGGRPIALVASRNRWRTAALGLGSLAAALAAFIVVDRGRLATPPAGGSGESYVAAINRGGDKPALLVRVDLATHKIYVMPVAAKAPTGHSLELWYIGDDKTPRAMGLVDQDPSTMPMPAGASPAGATFAVSVEPPGGSTTGGPTGPVVYSGQLVKQ